MLLREFIETPAVHVEDQDDTSLLMYVETCELNENKKVESFIGTIKGPVMTTSYMSKALPNVVATHKNFAAAIKAGKATDAEIEHDGKTFNVYPSEVRSFFTKDGHNKDIKVWSMFKAGRSVEHALPDYYVDEKGNLYKV